MKVFIHYIEDNQEFTDPKTGEIVEYQRAWVYQDEHFNTKNEKGRPITKVKIVRGSAKNIDGSLVPGWFECEMGMAAGGRQLIRSFKPLPKNENKAA
jgi:hypothetical protein